MTPILLDSSSALRPPLLVEANTSTATGGVTHLRKWQTSASTSVGTHGNASMPTTMSKMSRTSKNSVNRRHCRQVCMQNLSPRFPQAILQLKHFSSATLQQSSTWQTEAFKALQTPHRELFWQKGQNSYIRFIISSGHIIVECPIVFRYGSSCVCHN